VKDASRPVSLGLFVLVLMVFLLPFARVSCTTSETKGGVETKKVEEVVQGTGYEVAFGKRIPVNEGENWEPGARKPDLVAIAILVATLVGIGLVLVKGRRGAITRALFCDHCMLLVFALWANLSIRVSAAAGQLKMLAGYWATLAIFGVACVVNLIAIRHLPRAPAPPVEAGTAVGPDDS
jgi:hypothetical protein